MHYETNLSGFHLGFSSRRLGANTTIADLREWGEDYVIIFCYIARILIEFIDFLNY